MMALVVPSIPDEGHAADGLLVLLHLVDRKKLRTHPIKESRYSGVLATFARSTSRQDLSRSDREDLVNDSAELKLSSVPFEQPCDGRRCHRRPSQGCSSAVGRRINLMGCGEALRWLGASRGRT